MSVYTAGPWEAVLKDDPRGQPVPYFRGLIASIASEPPMSVVASSERIATQEQWEANALLISAAPDLLAAAKRALKALESLAPGTATNDANELRAAIAKAEGK